MTKATEAYCHVIIGLMFTPTVPVIVVAAIEKTTRALGNKNSLLWHVPADLKRFKTLTLGHPVIMGRKTFESIVATLGKPLPGRTNIVITRNPHYSYGANNVKVTQSLEEAFSIALTEAPTEIHIGGGAELYRESLPYVQKLFLTLFDDPTVDADTFFPEFRENFTIATEHPPQEHNGISFQWVDFVRSRN